MMNERLARCLRTLVLLLACVGPAAQAAQPGQAVALPALATMDGKVLSPAGLKGKVVVLAWFASYCPYCMQEAPKLQRLHKENADHLVVVGVNLDAPDGEREAKTRAWIRKYGWTFPVTMDAAKLERMLGRTMGIPSLVVIDRAGVVRQVEMGEMLDEDFDDIAAFARGQGK